MGLKAILQEISLVFLLISSYFAMVLTNWATIQVLGDVAVLDGTLRFVPSPLSYLCPSLSLLFIVFPQIFLLPSILACSPLHSSLLLLLSSHFLPPLFSPLIFSLLTSLFSSLPCRAISIFPLPSKAQQLCGSKQLVSG